MTNHIDISIIIPAKDEEKRLPPFLHDIIWHCTNSDKEYEIIVVDDGSTDKTSEVALALSAKFSNLKVLKLIKNRGKGFAVKCGFFEAKGEVVVFLDADGSTSAEEIENNIHLFAEGNDVVVGSRVLIDEKRKVHVLPYRKFIGQTFNFFVQLFLFKDIKDTQCGFKMFKKNTIQPIFSRMKIDRFGFDLEVLYLATRLDFKVKEVPINWHHVPESKTNLITDSLKMFINIFQVRIWHRSPYKSKQQNINLNEVSLIYQEQKKL